MALQLAAGLQAVHQLGIIHRDLKASNVMIAAQRRGQAHGLRHRQAGRAGHRGFTAPGQVLGTPEYMSPEHARGGKVDFRSDIYALGCVVFEIFTGQAPFRGANAFATISKHFNEPPPLEGALAALIPEALLPVLRKTLAKDPDERYASVTDAAGGAAPAQEATLGAGGGGCRAAAPLGSPRLRRCARSCWPAAPRWPCRRPTTR